MNLVKLLFWVNHHHASPIVLESFVSSMTFMGYHSSIYVKPCINQTWATKARCDLLPELWCFQCLV